MVSPPTVCATVALSSATV